MVLERSVISLTASKYQCGIRLCSAVSLQIFVTYINTANIRGVYVQIVVALHMADNKHFTRSCAGRAFFAGTGAPGCFNTIVVPQPETIHAILLVALC